MLVHVRRDRQTAKFWLAPVELAWNHGFSARELNERQTQSQVEEAFASLNEASTMNPRVDQVLADFLEGIKPARPHIQHVTLFGSRARGEHRSDSDYDLLIVVDRKTPALSDVLYESVMEVLLTHGRLVSLKVFEREQFEKLEEMATPFIRRVQEEGVSL